MGIPKWPPCPNIMTYMHIHTAHTHTYTRAHGTHIHTRVHDTYKVSVFSVLVHTYIHVYMIHIKCLFFLSICQYVCMYIYGVLR